jgi:hypothetical protein
MLVPSKEAASGLVGKDSSGDGAVVDDLNLLRVEGTFCGVANSVHVRFMGGIVRPDSLDSNESRRSDCSAVFAENEKRRALERRLVLSWSFAGRPVSLLLLRLSGDGSVRTRLSDAVGVSARDLPYLPLGFFTVEKPS